jgi:hypothetical protein
MLEHVPACLLMSCLCAPGHNGFVPMLAKQYPLLAGKRLRLAAALLSLRGDSG